MSPPSSADARRPNILIIVTDDQRFDTLRLTDSTTGRPWMAKTLQWFLGANGRGDSVGTEFTRAFATTPLCCPARASIMTGKYAHNHRVLGNFDKDNLDLATTLQHHLKSQPSPYHTGIFGKFLNMWVTYGGNPPMNPPDFDEWAIYDNGARYSHTPRPPCPDRVQRGINCVNDQGTLRQAPHETFETTFLADRASDFITRRATDPRTPWFLYVAPTVPHSPYRAEPRYENAPVPEPVITASNRPESDVADKPPYVHYRREAAVAFLRSDPSTWPTGGQCADVAADGLEGWCECVRDRIRPAMFRLLKSGDDMVDRIFTTLEETDQADNTLAFYTTDHGFLWNEHGLFEKPHPYYDMRIPMLMRWPDRVTTSTDSALVGNIDIMPTVMTAAGIPIPEAVDGRDLLAGDLPSRERLLLEYKSRWSSLVTAGGAQYTEYFHHDGSEPELWSDEHPVRADSPPGTPVREYYDLEADPLELSNLLHDGEVGDPSDEVLERLEQQLADARNCVGRGGCGGRPGCP